MALTFQRIIAPITNIDLLRDTLADDSIIGDAFSSILCYRPDENLVKVMFVRDLDADEALHLYSILDSYSESLPSDYKLYRYVDDRYIRSKSLPPLDVDFKRNLDRRLFVKVERDTFYRYTKRIHYSDLALTDPILEERFTYELDQFGDLENQFNALWFYKEDGAVEYSGKTLQKNYSINPDEKLEKSQELRSAFKNGFITEIRVPLVTSIIANGQVTAESITEAEQRLGFSLGASPEGDQAIYSRAAEFMAVQFLDDIQLELNQFVESASDAVVAAVQSHGATFLDNTFDAELTTFRAYTVSRFEEYLSA